MFFNHSLFVIACTLFACLNTSCRQQNKITAALIRFETSATEENASSQLNDSIRIYYYQDLVLYKLNYYFSSVSNNNGELTVKDEKSWPLWFVFNKDSARGYAFYEAHAARNRWETIDPFIYNNGMIQMDLGFLFNNNLTINFTKKLSAKEEICEEGYVFTDPKYAKDTLYISYSNKLKELPFSFDEKVDSVKGSKLFRIKTITGEKILPEINQTSRRMETILQLEQVPVDDQEEVINYSSKFRSLK